MRAFITGGAGFIGGHLSERLLEMGHRVVVIDDLSTGRIENLANIRSHPAFQYHIDTVFNRPLMTELVDSADVVFHLAAAVGVQNIVDSPVRTIETNVRGSELVLEMAARKGKRLMITSTSEVYGKSTKVPFGETDDLVLGSTYNSRWSYACSKAIDEFLALAYFREQRLPVSVVRLFNTAGPRQTGRYGMVLPRFVRQAMENKPVSVYGTGEQSRCFSHVADIIDGLLACISREDTAGEIFNLGNTQEITMNELALKVIQVTASSSQIEHIPYTEAYGPGFEDMYRRVPDISKARQWFGYEPKRGLDEIVRSVAKHVASEISSSGSPLPTAQAAAPRGLS